jgi:lipooligosaccharide transport system permease protein
MSLLHFRNGILPLCSKVIQVEMQSWLNELVTVLAVPLTFFLAFGLGLRGYIADIEGMSYTTFITPGLISMTILLEAYRTGAWGLWMDRWHQGMLDEYRIKPITTSDIIIGEILGGFVVALVKGTIVGLVLLWMTGLEMVWGNLLPYLAFMFPGCILFTCVGALVGTTFAKPDHIAQTQTIFITPLLYLGGVFFPIHSFPQWLIPFIQWLPTTAVFEGGRQALLTGTIEPAYLLGLMAAAGLSFLLSTMMFNRKLSE